MGALPRATPRTGAPTCRAPGSDLGSWKHFLAGRGAAAAFVNWGGHCHLLAAGHSDAPPLRPRGLPLPQQVVACGVGRGSAVLGRGTPGSAMRVRELQAARVLRAPPCPVICLLLERVAQPLWVPGAAGGGL